MDKTQTNHHTAHPFGFDIDINTFGCCGLVTFGYGLVTFDCDLVTLGCGPGCAFG